MLGRRYHSVAFGLWAVSDIFPQSPLDMQRSLTGLLLISLLLGRAIAQTPLANWFDLQWEAELGLSTFRTQLTIDPETGHLVFPSNGERRDMLGDPKDGVYVIDPATGQVLRHLHQDGPIDGDVNGVALADDWLYFGDDQRTVYAYRQGERAWYYPIGVKDPVRQGDLERAPVLADLTGDAVLDVVIAAEEYGLLALDGRDGTRLWEVSGQMGHGHGLNQPALLDVNDDGTPDLIWGTRTEQAFKGPGDRWGTYGDWLMALDGRDGSLLWQVPTYSAIHASPQVIDLAGESYVLLAATYSTLHLLTPQGQVVAKEAFPLPEGGISAFFSSPFLTDAGRVIIGTSWWGEEDGVWVVDLTQQEPVADGPARLPQARFIRAGRVSATAVSGDVMPAPGPEVLIPTEAGELLILATDGSLLERLVLPAGVEASVLVADIDQDGRVELVIASLDGWLRCYEPQ